MTKESYEYNGERTKECSCGVVLFFVNNERTGRPMPIEKESGEPHWNKCRHAAKFRKQRKRTG